MKRKNKRKKKLEAQNLSQGKPQYDRNTIKDDKYQENSFDPNKSTVSKDDEVMSDRITVKVSSEQNVTEREQVMDISYKEHLTFVGIGIVFCIILYMVSFLV